MFLRISEIKTEQDYKEALERLEVIFDANKNTTESDRLELLVNLIEKYEDKYFPINIDQNKADIFPNS